MKFIPLSFCLMAIPLAMAAQVRPRATSYFDATFNGVIAHFVDGGSWKSILTLVNLDTSSGTYTLHFYADDGSPLTIQTTAGTGNTVTGTIPASGSRVIETAGTNAALSEGWALLETSNNIRGSAIFRQSILGRPDFEASLPVVTYVNANRYALPFDDTNSATGVAVANPLSYTAMTTFVTFRDEQGLQFSLDSFTLAPFWHTAFKPCRSLSRIGRQTWRG